MESNQIHKTKALPQAIYTAVGRVAGTYQPSAENSHSGIFVTCDGLSIPAKMTGRLRSHLEKKYKEYASRLDLFQQLHQWIVYPKTEPLRFDLLVIKPLSPELVVAPKADEFKMVGQIQPSSDKNVTIRIQRNQPYNQGNKTKKSQSFELTLEGTLPAEAVGQLWQLEVQRKEASLVVVAGQPYEASDEDKLWLLQNASRKALALANKKAAKNKQANTLLKAADDDSKAGIDNKARNKFGIGVPQEEVASELQAIAPNEEYTPLAATDTAQTEQLAEQPLAITQQNTLAQQSGSKRKYKANATSHQSATVRPVQQRQQKTSIPQSQHSLTGSEHLPSLKSSAAEAKTNAQQRKPAFKVKVNDQVFSGYDSVTLNNRMLRIDGKAVAQAKMVIVVGQPLSMQADGKVTQKDNSAVLISR